MPNFGMASLSAHHLFLPALATVPGELHITNFRKNCRSSCGRSDVKEYCRNSKFELKTLQEKKVYPKKVVEPLNW